MIRIKYVFFVLVSVVLLSCYGSKQATIEPSSYTVNLFLLIECKVCQAMTPYLSELEDDYAGLAKFDFVGYFPETMFPEEGNISEWKDNYNIKFDCHLDVGDEMTRTLQAEIAPQAIVVDNSSGLIVYSGRINNLFAALGKKRPQVTDHTLSNILEALRNGEPIEAQNDLTPIGCIISSK